MEVVFTDQANEYINNGRINGLYGDLNHLNVLGIQVQGIVYDDEWTVKRFLNGYRFRLNSRITSLFAYLDLDIKILNVKIKCLAKTDLKFVLLAYLLLHNYKNIIFDYFDIGLSYKDQKRLVKIIRNLRNDGFAVLIISNNLIFLDSIVENILVINKDKIVFEGKIGELIKDYSKYIDKLDILSFIEMANKKGAKLDITLDSKELLKDIYRSVY